eukprot:Stramenopile-MAST_4_protein_2054
METLEARPPKATPPHTGTGILEIKLSSKTQLTRAQKARIVCGRGEPAALFLVALATGGSCPESWKGDKYCDDNDYTYDETMRAFRALGIALPDIEPVPNSECNTASCGFDGGDCPAPR